MTSLCIAVVTHSAVKLILLNICCLLLWKVISLAYCSIGRLRSKICFIVTDFSGVTPLYGTTKRALIDDCMTFQENICLRFCYTHSTPDYF